MRFKDQSSQNDLLYIIDAQIKTLVNQWTFCVACYVTKGNGPALVPFVSGNQWWSTNVHLLVR